MVCTGLEVVARGDCKMELFDVGAKKKTSMLTDKQVTDNQVYALYAEYPNKVAPLAAFRAIRRALKLATYADLLAGVKRYANKVECEQTEKRFQAHPATWFNAGRWMDDTSTAPGRNPKWAPGYVPQRGQSYEEWIAWEHEHDRDPWAKGKATP